MNRRLFTFKVASWLRLVGLATLAISLLVLIAPVPAAVQAATNGTLWTVEYYNNTTLSGYPAYTTQAASIGFNWMDTPPVAGVGADNYSMRYTGVQTLAAGTYTIQAKADDGVRVWLDSMLVINAFGTSSGQAYTYTFNAGAGQHVIVVEYYEGNGVAFLDFRLQQADTVPNPAVASGTVTAYVLNVRSQPNPYSSNVLTKIYRGEVYAVVGRNTASSWWQINANGSVGWVNGSYFYATNTQNVPVTDGGTVPVPTTPTAGAIGNLNIRSGPGVQYGVVGWLPANQMVQVIGRSAYVNWYQIRYGNVTGWVNGQYLSFTAGTDVNSIPVTDSGTVPTPTPTTATAGAIGNLNIRSGPNAAYSIVGWLPANQMVQVIGRSATVNWYQIRYGSVTGWVTGVYLSFTAGTDVSVIPVTG